MKSTSWLVLGASLLALAAPAARAQCTAAETAKLLAPDDAAQDEFGAATATDGQRILVGAAGNDDGGADSGSAYVYAFNGLAWSHEAKLTAPDAAAGDRFGVSVAMGEQLAVIGARNDDSPAADAGSVYLFQWINGQWLYATKLTAHDAAAGDQFGAAVAISGTTLVVGAPGDDDGGSGAGAAYVFTHNGTSWAEVTKLTGSDSAAGDAFGRSVAISGDRIVCGAWLAQTTAPGTGVAYVYALSGSTWTEEQTLVASNAAEGDNFGSAVAISGGIVVVGAWLQDTQGANAGAAYVFRFTGGQWAEETTLLAPDGAANDSFGNAVAVNGELALIGSAADDDPTTNSGSAYVYRCVDGIWGYQGKLRASDSAINDAFGTSVALVDKLAVIGAPQNDDGGTNSGAAYVMSGLGDCNLNGLLDLCDVDAGTSADCNHNGAPDECDLADGTSEDVNGNSIPDECEPDCDGDGLPDAWELSQGTETDCNGNLVPDACDVRTGFSADCDGDEYPDECEVLGLFQRESPPLGPVGAGTPQSFTVSAPPEAGLAVTLTFEAVADLGAPTEWIDVNINGTGVGRVFGPDGSDCPGQPDEDSLNVAADVFNAAVGGGNAVIHMVASAQVDPALCAAGSYIRVRVQYQAVGPDDCNANGVPDLCDVLAGTSADENQNGIPDECEGLTGDVNCDNSVGFADINAFVLLLSNPAAWQALYPGCPAENGDVNLNGTVGFDDINPFVALLAGD